MLEAARFVYAKVSDQSWAGSDLVRDPRTVFFDAIWNEAAWS